jgi:hypothetical protein
MIGVWFVTVCKYGWRSILAVHVGDVLWSQMGFQRSCAALPRKWKGFFSRGLGLFSLGERLLRGLGK